MNRLVPVAPRAEQNILTRLKLSKSYTVLPQHVFPSLSPLYIILSLWPTSSSSLPFHRSSFIPVTSHHQTLLSRIRWFQLFQAHWLLLRSGHFNSFASQDRILTEFLRAPATRSASFSKPIPPLDPLDLRGARRVRGFLLLRRLLFRRARRSPGSPLSLLIVRRFYGRLTL